MTRRANLAAIVGMAMTLSVAAPVAVWAGEHGGTAVAEGQEHGGAAMAEGSHGMTEKGEAALLKEAAAALRKGEARPDLAAKLETLAKADAQK